MNFLQERPVLSDSFILKSDITEDNFDLKFEAYQTDLAKAQKMLQSLSGPYQLDKTSLSLLSHGLTSLQTQTKTMRLEAYGDSQEALKLRCEGVVDSIIDGIKKMIDWIVDKFKALFGGDSEESSSDTLSNNESKKVTEVAAEATPNNEKPTSSETVKPKESGMGTGIVKFFVSNDNAKITSGLKLYAESLKKATDLFNQSFDILSKTDMAGIKSKENEEKIIKELKEILKFGSQAAVENESKPSEEGEYLGAWFVNGKNRKAAICATNHFKLSNVEIKISEPESLIVDKNFIFKIHKDFNETASKNYLEMKKLLNTKIKPLGDKLKAQVEKGSENEVGLAQIKIDFLKNIVGTLSSSLKKSQIDLCRSVRNDLKTLSKEVASRSYEEENPNLVSSNN